MSIEINAILCRLFFPNFLKIKNIIQRDNRRSFFVKYVFPNNLYVYVSLVQAWHITLSN